MYILFSSNVSQLKEISKIFFSQRRIEYIDEERNILNNLIKSQNILNQSGRIPKISLLKVENFLNQIKNDINEFELNIKK